MGLASVDIMGNARLGCDGGRRALVFLQLHAARVGARECLLFDDLLSKHVLSIRMATPGGTIGVLEPVRLVGGDMIQGLSISLSGYTLIPPWECYLRYHWPALVYISCSSTSHHGIEKGDTHCNMTLGLSDARTKACRIRQQLNKSSGQWAAPVLAAAGSWTSSVGYPWPPLLLRIF